ncbi:MAG: hypothetical protein WAV28_13580 [Sedimentisphaerales bacterium]
MSRISELKFGVPKVQFSFKVVDARIDARPGNSKLVFSSFRLRVSSFDTSFDTDKQASTTEQLFLITN